MRLGRAVFASAAITLAAPASAQSEWKTLASEYAFLAPDFDSDLSLQKAWVLKNYQGDVRFTLITCTPGPKLKVNGFTRSQSDVRSGAYFVNSFYKENVKGKIKYDVKSSGLSDAGEPYFMIVTTGPRIIALDAIVEKLPLCRTEKPLTDSQIKDRFGIFSNRDGRTALNPDGTGLAIDYKWYVPGKVLLLVHREFGKGWGATSMVVYDAKSDSLRLQRIDGNFDLEDQKLDKDAKLTMGLYPYQQDRKMPKARSSSGGGFMAGLTGAIMGAATGYADSGGSSAGAIVGAVGGVAVGKAGGNDALYAQMEDTRARVTAEADASQRQLERTIAQAERQAAQQRAAASASAPVSGGQSAGDRVVAQEQARAAQLQQERAARATEQQRLAQQEATAVKQRQEQAKALAEAERNRPVEWAEGVVLCEPRQNSEEWRCTGPLQMNILKLDAANTNAQLGLACGSSNGIREIGPVGSYRAFGCGFGIHPTATSYPGNHDVPREFGVFVSDRRVFHCPTSKDAYCRTP